MGVLMLSDAEMRRALEKFRGIEARVRAAGVIIDPAGGNDNDLLSSTDPIAPVLRTALVINWSEKLMKPRYEAFREKFPEIQSLSRLKAVMDESDPLVFCERYLGINANSERPRENPKYQLLAELVSGFLEYQESLGLPSEIQAIRHWATNVNVSNLKSDPVGNRRGVGVAVVENIRLNLGMPVVKPDRHVVNGVKEHLGLATIKPDEYTSLAEALGLAPRYFDAVLFEFGKLPG